MKETEDLGDKSAVAALSQVAAIWTNKRGAGAIAVVLETREKAKQAYEATPAWARGVAQVNKESGNFSRKMLSALLTGDDDEVAMWARAAVDAQKQATGQMLEPLSLSIFGIIVIGGILAARVKKIGSVEFYEGVPKELGDVLKIGAGISSPTEK